MLKVGDKAPDFSLPDKNDHIHKLSDYKGKNIVLYFYPKDNTPGCTRQACAFANIYNGFKELDVIVIGISKDSVESHYKFAKKHNLPFVLLSDSDLEAIKAYGVWREKKMYGKVTMGVLRSTFIIDKEGTIIKVFEKANPDNNAIEILEYLRGKNEEL